MVHVELVRHRLVGEWFADSPEFRRDLARVIGMEVEYPAVAPLARPGEPKAAEVVVTIQRVKRYKIADGDGLHLLVLPTGVKSWRWRRIHANGRETTTTLGRFPKMSVEDARAARDKLRAAAEVLAARGN